MENEQERWGMNDERTACLVEAKALMLEGAAALTKVADVIERLEGAGPAPRCERPPNA